MFDPPLHVVGKADRPAQFEVFPQPGIGKIEADVTHLELRRPQQPYAALRQRRGERLAAADQVEIVLVQRVQVQPPLQEHQVGGHRLLDLVEHHPVRQRQRPGPVGGIFRLRIVLDAVIRIPVQPQPVVVDPLRQPE
ncbi:hypothetical protein SDC9_154998 [bioreactor metagenome]|uniref:Uncharacterized protein n=1 Tax=bioreactor metagenome TaxID=1076179 RepID=A0A645F0K9_9ZZZZ